MYVSSIADGLNYIESHYCLGEQLSLKDNMCIRSYPDREHNVVGPLTAPIAIYSEMELEDNALGGFPEVTVDEECSNDGCKNEAEEGGKCLHCIWADK
jgi:hypothetical protein